MRVRYLEILGIPCEFPPNGYKGMYIRMIAATIIAFKGDTSALIQLYAVVAVLIWSGLLTYVLLKAINFLLPLRVSEQHEIEGLDLTQHGEALQ